MSLEHDLATLAAAQAQVGGLQSQARQADAAIAREQATVAQTKLNLSSGSPPWSGSVANKTPARSCAATDSFQGGTDSSFVLLPNATGNS
jgi:hypothetical protein